MSGLCYTAEFQGIADMTSLTLTLPDDWHIHLRDGPAALAVTVPDVARCGVCHRHAYLAPPVLTVNDAILPGSYSVTRCGSVFEPLMTLYLTDDTTINHRRRSRLFLCAWCQNLPRWGHY